MKNKLIREYSCSLFELYSVSETAIRNLILFLATFGAFRKVYDAAFVTKIKKLLTDAIALPDGQKGYAGAEILHGQMESAGDVCLRKFRLLKRYIINAYTDPIERNTHLVTAGATAYKNARNGNWESMSGMNNAMLTFIDENKIKLEADNNMPDEFIKEVEDAATDFGTKYSDFKLIEQTAEVTAAKVKANNILYQAIMNMLQDGQAIFEEQPEVAQRFVFSSILDMITVQNTGVKVKVKSVPDNMVVSDAQISIQKPGEPAEVLDVNDDGELERRIAAGPVKLVVTAPGKQPETIMVTLEGGSYKSIEVELRDAA